MGVLQRLFGRTRNAAADTTAVTSPGRVVLAEEPAAIYAIGDVHGHVALLRALEALIVEDARSIPGEKWIVMLGDYVDRGPASAQVIDHLLGAPPDGFVRLCIAGNHEAEMVNFMRMPGAGSAWLEFGGRETLRSYGIAGERIAGSRRMLRQLVASHVPDEHLAFIASLPVMIETPNFVFVHAGIRPGIATAEQALQDLLWYRDDFAERYDELGKTVVHGHTVRDEVLLSRRRIAVDTGAFLTGRLSAVKLTAGGGASVIAACHDR